MDSEELLRRYAAGERDFSKLNLTSLGSLREECLVDVNFRHANLTGANLIGANLTGVDFTGANLTGADLTQAELIETNFNGADLTNTIFKDALFCRTIMPYGIIKNDPTRILTSEEFLKAYAAGERMFPGIVILRANLSGKDLRGVDLVHHIYRYRAHLSRANLSYVNWEECWLNQTNFLGSNLSGANLKRASLRGTDFSYANLRGANLLYADMEGANFTGADLTGAETSNPSLYWCTFFHNTTMPDGSVIVEPTIYD